MSEKKNLFSWDFGFWLGARFFSNMARKMVEVALAWQIYQISHDPLALGLMGLAEALPFLGVSLWAGHLVDRHSKKPFMIGAELILLLCTCLFFSLTFVPHVPLFLLYVILGITGVGISFGSIASNVFVQMTIPKEHFSRAAAWNLASFTTATVVGPIWGGWILSRASGRWVYALSIVCFLAALAMISGLRPLLSLEVSPQEPALKRVKEGIRFVRSQPFILACMSLDMVAVLFGDAVAVFPIFADILKAGPFGFGLLRASPPLGSFFVSMIHNARPFIHSTWGQLKKAVFAFGICMICFALSSHIAVAVLCLILSGAVDGISVIIRQSVYQAHTPDALRGRVAALSGIFISTSNEIGAFESGLSARLMGPIPSVIFGGCVTLASVFVMGWKFRGIEEK